MEIIDLRSDTVTIPTPEMREAMFKAEVGDDVYGDDPTVNELEKLAASMMSKEAALFVPSGTMGNQVAVMSWTNRGDEIILEVEAHMYYYEVAGLAVLSGVQARTVKGERGIMSPQDVEAAIRPYNIHFPRTSLICVENTHNRGGGKVVPQKVMKDIYEVGQRYRIPVHLDGARIFNASVFLGIPVKEITRYSDSVMFCLSKGLSAPVGSLLVGDSSFINRARKYRKMLGGGMRQVGVIAAAGLVALRTMVNRLKEDHDNAKVLALGLIDVSYLKVDPSYVETNMVRIELKEGYDAYILVEKLKEQNILCNPINTTSIRLVTHKDINRDLVLRAIEIFKNIKF